ncbi:MAG: hypothetical protein NVS3B28_13180 [Candidatus Velthaea sp.]
MVAKQVNSARAISRGAILRLQIPPNPRHGKYVRARVTDFAVQFAVLDEDLQEFMTAIGEAFANAVEHAQCKDTIEISCWFAGEQLIATIVDNGVGFTGAERLLVDSELPDNLSERGRGLAIMHRCTDLFTVRSAPGKGTAVVLGRHLRGNRRG